MKGISNLVHGDVFSSERKNVLNSSTNQNWWLIKNFFIPVFTPKCRKICVKLLFLTHGLWRNSTYRFNFNTWTNVYVKYLYVKFLLQFSHTRFRLLYLKQWKILYSTLKRSAFHFKIQNNWKNVYRNLTVKDSYCTCDIFFVQREWWQWCSCK